MKLVLRIIRMRHFFGIKINQNTVEIHTEFPWTLRNSLITFSPKIKNAKSKKEVEIVFVEYIRENLVLTDKEGKKLPFLNFKELKTDGHSHGNSYLLTFQGKDLAEIRNTMMFNSSEKQINFHTMGMGKNGISFETTADHPDFLLDKDTKLTYWYYLIFFPIAVYFLIYFKRNGKFNS